MTTATTWLAWMLSCTLTAGSIEPAGTGVPAPGAQTEATESTESTPERSSEEGAGTVVEGDQITVTASGLATALAETPTAVTVLDAEELEKSAALALDDTLRQVPGFTLFRRSGSRAANPTTQGASLRGVGGSAASRALVLADGVPLNDPFGGWVYWSRVPGAALERVEVVRGGASDLYGSAALVGVAHLVRRDPGERALQLEASAGELETEALSLWAADERGSWAGAVAADLLSTEGYVPVAPDERGAVDAPAGVDHAAIEATAAWEPVGGDDRVFVRGSWYDEERTNGTAIQGNDTRIGRLTIGADGGLGGGGASGASYQLRAWGGDQELHQLFSAVADDRDSERKVREQNVPSNEVGLDGRLVLPSTRHTLIAGLALRRLQGESRERVFLPSAELSIVSGGEQLLGGLFVEDLIRVGERVSAQVALRYDRWRNEEGFRTFQSSTERFPDRTEEAWSPRLALHVRATQDWGLTASAYRSFRAPTLNELYRGFRVGDVVTDPNERLGAERLNGAEVGVIWTPWDGTGRGRGAWRVRGTLFWMELEDAIANVTQEVTAELIRRQRQNLGRIRSRGAELEVSGRLAPSLTLDAGYLWTDSEVVDYSADPTLEGRRTPQVPEHEASLQLGWRAPFDLRAHLQARWADDAYDDDLNRFPLGELTVVDLQLARPLGPGWELFAAAENLLDDDSVVGRTPVTTLGSPRLVRVGVRYRRSP